MMNNNQIDLGRIYGIQSPQNQQNEYGLSNFVTQGNIPSLEQIASYNLASRGIYPQQASMSDGMLDTNYPTGVPYDVNFDAQSSSQEPFVSTPTTTLEASESIPPNQNSIAQGNIGAITDYSNPFPVTADSIQYLNGFIRTQVGRRITVTFLLGSSRLEERSGYLLGVGANYILINELETNDITACDFYNIKFIRFYY